MAASDVSSGPAGTQAIIAAAHINTLNRKKTYFNDSSQTPWFDFVLSKARASVPYQHTLETLLGRETGQGVEYVQGADVRTFETHYHDLAMRWTPRERHMGRQWLHSELRSMGYTVPPNEARGKDFAKHMSKDDFEKLRNYFEEQIASFDNDWHINQDEMWHRDGTQNSLAPVGLDGLLPINNTTGVIGQQSRSDSYFQHNVQTGLTTGASGTLETGMRQVIRACENTSRRRPSRITHMYAGDDFIDGYIAFARANGMPYERNGGKSATKRVDIATPDAACYYRDIPIYRDPTAAKLDAKGAYSGTVWAKRCYMIAESTWEFHYSPGLMKHFSYPMDPPDQRLTRMSIDEESVLVCTKPNGNGLVTIA